MHQYQKHRDHHRHFKTIRAICVIVMVLTAFEIQHVKAQSVPVVPAPSQPVPTDTIPNKPAPGLPVQPDSVKIGGIVPDSSQVGESRINPNRARVQTKEFELKFPVYLLNAPQVMQSAAIQTDSTLRWNQWLDYSELVSRSKGVISHRLGGFNRNDFHLIDDNKKI